MSPPPPTQSEPSHPGPGPAGAERKKFPDFVPPTKIHYDDGRPATLHLQKCRLVVEEGNRSHEHSFDQPVITIGAMDDNDVVMNDSTVSRYHCKIVQEESSWVLCDLGSTNGTFINRVRIREAYLKPGCTVSLGTAELKFYSAEERVEIIPSKKDHCGDIVGKHARMRELYAIIEKIAPTGTTVVIEGETGTGKEVIASTIHKLSTRAGGPMMVFDCGAVPENLIESELFGHEKGSFTGAVMTRQGLFEMAHGGTLFLDELGELSIDLQPKLLRALEQREVRRVGGQKSIKVDVRVIAATNRNLEEEVKSGRFRQDLFYRLSVVRLFLAPLRERVEDIPLLVKHFLKSQAGNREPDGTLRVRQVSRDAMDLLCAYKWPGNVRELVNSIERACSFVEGDTIQVADLPESVRITGSGAQSPAGARGHGHGHGGHGGDVGADSTFKEAKERWVSSFERDYLVQLLKKSNGNISHAAREADIDRKYFRKLMKKYAIDGGHDAVPDDDE